MRPSVTQQISAVHQTKHAQKVFSAIVNKVKHEMIHLEITVAREIVITHEIVTSTEAVTTPEAVTSQEAVTTLEVVTIPEVGITPQGTKIPMVAAVR